MKKIYTEITINASKEKVWQVLTNFSQYHQWNPFIIKSQGKAAQGEKISNTMLQDGKEMTFTPVITKSINNQELEWIGHLWFKGLFDGTHFFRLETIDKNTTKLIQGETFKGIFSGLILAMIKENTHKGFVQMNEALKKKVEK